MKVSFLDLRGPYLELKDEIDQAIHRVVNSGWYILGEEVDAFEDLYAKYCGAAHCVGVANGLDALHLGLLALGVGPGDEVIVPSNTYIATWLAVSHTGAVPVPSEPDRGTCNINPVDIESIITSRTKAIIPVHLYGQPADLDPILEVARRYGLKVLEDGAQAHGARYRGKRIGAHGDAVAWSFYPSKNLGALGDGGAITTNSSEIAAAVRLLRNYGSRKKDGNEVKGFNSRLDPLQAAVLSVKLKHLDEWNSRRRYVARQYLQKLVDLDLLLPNVPEWAEPVWHLFVVRSSTRDELRAVLNAREIATMIHYPVPPHLQPAYADLGFVRGAFPISEEVHETVVSLPIGPHVTDSEVEAVVNAVRDACL